MEGAATLERQCSPDSKTLSTSLAEPWARPTEEAVAAAVKATFLALVEGLVERISTRSWYFLRGSRRFLRC